MLTDDPARAAATVRPARVLRRTTQVMLAVWVVLAVGQLIGKLIKYGLGRDTAFGIVPLLDLNQESSLGTWVSGLLLATCAVLSACGALAARGPERPWRANWWLLSGVFLLLSMDEVSAVHDKLTPYLRAALGGTTGVLYFAWVLPALVLGLVFLLLQLRFLRHLGPTGSALALAGCVYVLGAAGFEMAQGVLSDGDGTGSPYGIFPTIEELLEFAGVMLALRALLRHLLATLAPRLTVTVEQ